LIPFAADISDRTAVKDLFAFAVKELGYVDILVNNAGGNVPNRALDVLSPEDFELMVNVNLNGTFYCVHEALPGMRERGDGLIINVSSIAGVRASIVAGAGYVASKHGMAGLSMAIGLEESRHGIRSCNICPGEVNTPILDGRPSPPSSEARQTMMGPEDVAQAILFAATMPARTLVEEIVMTPAKPRDMEHELQVAREAGKSP